MVCAAPLPPNFPQRDRDQCSVNLWMLASYQSRGKRSLTSRRGVFGVFELVRSSSICCAVLSLSRSTDEFVNGTL